MKPPESLSRLNKRTKAIFAPFRFVGLFGERNRNAPRYREPAAPPGIEHLEQANEPPEPNLVRISTIDFCESRHLEQSYESIDELISSQKPDWSTTRWVDIQGVHPYVLKQLQENFGIHPLAAEDALHVPQRPKVEEYDNSIFVILKMLRFEGRKLINEQVSFFYFEDTIITIQETHGDVWERVRQRTQKNVSRFRQYGTPYLFYALIDAIIDHIFPFLDLYFDSIDTLEQEILENPTPGAQSRIHAIKRELAYLRQAIWPMQKVISTLAKDEFEKLPPEVENYFRDVYDHATQATEAIDMYRDTANGLQDLYMAASSNKMNEVMKALTIMASLFLPLTFLAGVYGMNFEYIPELGWKHSYLVFWAVCIASLGGLLWYFKRKGWIGK